VEGPSWVSMILLWLDVLVDGLPPTRYQDVPDAQLEGFVRLSEGAPSEWLDILLRVVVVGHLAPQGLGGVGGARGGGLGAGLGQATGGAPEAGETTVARGVLGVLGRDPAVPLAIVPLARFPPPSAER